MQTLLVFLFFLLLPFLLFRATLATLAKRVLKMHPFIRNEYKFHHAHFGIGILLVGVLSFFLSGVTVFGAGVIGLGLGMVLDQFFVSLTLPEPEPETTIKYLKTFWPTLFLLAAISILFLLCFLVVQNKFF